MCFLKHWRKIWKSNVQVLNQSVFIVLLRMFMTVNQKEIVVYAV